jgi:hypothetical protein
MASGDTIRGMVDALGAASAKLAKGVAQLEADVEQAKAIRLPPRTAASNVVVFPRGRVAS